MPVGQKISRSSGGGGGCCCGGCCGCLFVLAGLTGLAIFLGVYLTDAETPQEFLGSLPDPRDFIPNLDEFFKEDPFNGFNSTDPDALPKWRNSGEGLTLELLNACDDRWDSFFDEAVANWDNGTPDVMTLTTAKISVDPDCTPVDDKMKVCNNDYGDTRWKGINEVLFDERTGIIAASVAKMNEFYLLNADDPKKLYTMCHEIGHGFGLPHSDESFTNRDTGECMDYTNNYSNNMRPGPSNFEFLARMYGTVPGSSRRRMLRGKNVPKSVWERYHEIMPHLENGTLPSRHAQNLRLLEESEYVSIVQFDLGHGYKVYVRKLLATL